MTKEMGFTANQNTVGDSEGITKGYFRKGSILRIIDEKTCLGNF